MSLVPLLVTLRLRCSSFTFNMNTIRFSAGAKMWSFSLEGWIWSNSTHIYVPPPTQETSSWLSGWWRLVSSLTPHCSSTVSRDLNDSQCAKGPGQSLNTRNSPPVTGRTEDTSSSNPREKVQLLVTEAQRMSMTSMNESLHNNFTGIWS